MYHGVIVLLVLDICNGGHSERPRNENQQMHNSEEQYVFDFDCVKQKRKEILWHYGYPESSADVERRSALNIHEFWELYDGKWPVIITDIVPRWNAYRMWSKEFFHREYGDVQVVLTSVQGGLRDAVAGVQDLQTFIRTLDDPPGPTSWTYMEDELFLVLRPSIQTDVWPNPLLDENFFDFFPKEIKPWNSMMLWGTRYSRSPLHMDPYNWTALSAVIWGHKKWKVTCDWRNGAVRRVCIPRAACTFHFVNEAYIQCIACNKPYRVLLGCMCISSTGATCRATDKGVDTFSPDYLKYPKFRRAKYLEVDQYSGELLVVPSGWFHQAYNDEETLSVSSQLMNRNNYLIVLEEIVKGGNLSWKKLPPLFHTLSSPDQVKLFLSLIPKRILEKGRELTDGVLRSLDVTASKQEL